MIIYKRNVNAEDIDGLKNDEELIYYKNDEMAITINRIKDSYVVRKKRISDNELIEESFLKSIAEIMEFLEK